MRVDSDPASLNEVTREDKPEKQAFVNAGRLSDPARKAEIQIQDTVRLSSDGLNPVTAIEAKALATPDMREDKIAALRNTIQKGEYNVGSEEIADAMLKDHET
jgi:flagellar biosynthesis anti-sigma factor FlgM